MSIGTDRRYLELTDSDGLRHLIKVSSVQWLSDFDTCRDETLLTAAGRTIHLRLDLDVVRDLSVVRVFETAGGLNEGRLWLI